MNDELKENFLSRSTWIRAAYMLVFVIIYSIAKILIVAVVIFQLLSKLLFGQANAQLLKLGHSLAIFIYQIISYLTYNTDDKPFPFGDWPAAESPGPKRKKAPTAKKKLETKKDDSAE